ncbi:hypothetical protein BKA70DRAFT_1439284 [Coprinopsis sp. MPI-PUGE-AT-0042]|nr:hypothetical protein BKA70DRAFT_1439284 [Coprinopsis sp. MPI-PUGE-AT-0042]
MRENELLIERLEQDRRFFAHREREEREKKEQEREANDTLPSAPISVTQTLTDLRLTHAHLLEEHGATSVSVHQRTAELASLESQNAQSFKLVQPLESEVRVAKEDATRIDLRLMLVERDVGYLQALLESLKAEEVYGDNAIPTVDQVKVGRMEELEALLAEYKSVNGQLANDLEALEGPMVSTDEFENVKKENKARWTISEHGQEIASQATKIDELEQALLDLSCEIARGRHVPPKTCVSLLGHVSTVLNLCTNEAEDETWWFEVEREVPQRIVRSPLIGPSTQMRADCGGPKHKNTGGCATRACKSPCAHGVGAASLDGISQVANSLQLAGIASATPAEHRSTFVSAIKTTSV